MSEVHRPRRWLRWAVVLGVGSLAACSDGGTGGGGPDGGAADGASTSIPAPVSNSTLDSTLDSTPGVSVIPGQTTPIDPSASTSGPPTASETVPETVPKTVPVTLAAPTTSIAPLTDADRLAASRMASAFAALPQGWTGQPANVLNGVTANSGMLFVAACLAPSDYDVATLDADSAASWELAATGVPAVTNAPAPTATIGARVFIDASQSDAAFDTVRRVLSTTEGLACIAEQAPRQLAGFAPPGATFTADAEPLTVDGAEIGVRVSVSLVAGGAAVDVYVDVAVTQGDDGVLLFATFISYDNPVDSAVASALFAAAAADGP